MTAESAPHQPANHVFVDFENIKTIDAAVVSGKNLTFHLFFGPQNLKLDIALVEVLLEHAQAVKMIRSPKSGKNALDFVLAYHLGQAVLADPKGYYHIVSKDGGFDSLVELLKTKQVKVKRHMDWSGLHFTSAPKSAAEPPSATATPAPPPAAPKALSAAAETVLANLRKSAKSRPKRKKTLVSHAGSFLGKDATADAAERVVEELAKAKHIAIDDKGAVSYKL